MHTGADSDSQREDGLHARKSVGSDWGQTLRKRFTSLLLRSLGDKPSPINGQVGLRSGIKRPGRGEGLGNPGSRDGVSKLLMKEGKALS